MAIYVLFNASTSKTAKQLIIQDGKQQLLALFQLKQPNNHDIAYMLLKHISGQDFGPQNIEAWEQWITTAATNKNKGKANA